MRVSIFCLLLMMVVPAAAFAQASNVYVTPGGAATGNCPAGTSSAPNLTPAGFNTPGNWGSGAGKIGAGTTVLLCGTFSEPAHSGNLLTFQGSGASGNPIVFNFDTGANITAPSWTAVVISTGTQSYITIDGKTNGIIQATANGTLLTYQDDGGVCVTDAGGSNLTVQNLTCSNIYVHYCASGASSCSDEGGQNTSAIYMSVGSNITVKNNTVHDCRNCLGYGAAYSVASSNISVTGNTCYHANICFELSDNNPSGYNTSGVVVSGNNFYDGYTWAEDANYNHGDGMHIFVNNPGVVISGLQVDGNWIHGNWSWNTNDTHINAFVFVEGPNASFPSPEIFNNILEDDSTAGHNGNGLLSIGGNSPLIANNTMNGFDGLNWSGTNATVENNVFLNTSCAYTQVAGATIATMNYNNYYGVSNWQCSNGGSIYSLGAWQSTCSCDGQSNNTAPGFSGGTLTPPISTQMATNYMPSSSSTALAKQGQNLTNMSVSQLDSDYASVARPSGSCPSQGGASCWDIGAYFSGNTTTTVLPPTNLNATVE